MDILRLTLNDYEALKHMPTAIEDDYVKQYFPWIVGKDRLYGAFDGKRMTGIAGYTVIAHRYAVLGRLRTNIRDRGRGVASLLLQFVHQKAVEDLGIEWVGFVTQVDNIPVLHIADKLGLQPSETVHFCHLNEIGRKALLKEGAEEKHTWQEVTSFADKRQLFMNLSKEDHDLGVFPYEGYYLLPYESPLWNQAYLDVCKCWKKGNRFFMLMPDEKGRQYYHLKYLWDDSFEQKGLWPKVIEEADKEGRIVWYDVSTSGFARIPDSAYFDSDSPWVLYGRHLRDT